MDTYNEGWEATPCERVAVTAGTPALPDLLHLQRRKLHDAASCAMMRSPGFSHLIRALQPLLARLQQVTHVD